MPRFGQIRTSSPKAPAPFQHITLIGSVIMAVATGIMVYSNGGPERASQSVQPPAAQYYPVNRATPDLRGRTELEPLEIAPAKPVPVKPAVKLQANSGPAMLADLKQDSLKTSFWASNTERGHDFYGGRWAAENIKTTDDGLELQVQHEPTPKSPFSMAEFRSRKEYGYGRYEAVMQIGKGSGLVSAFFMYTGPYANTPHDEIDIEFLGKDTTKIEFNYWRSGQKGAHAVFDLPFDASEAPHLYAFEWTPDQITWFVDGEPFYSTKPGDTKIPTHAGRMYFSHWTGVPAMAQWHGKPKFASGEATKVSCASFTPLGEDAPSCADTFDPNQIGERLTYAGLIAHP